MNAKYLTIGIGVLLVFFLSKNSAANTPPSELCTGSPCRNLWVSSVDGNDTNDCLSEGNACRTVGRAVALATNPGDTVNIKEGTYTDTYPGCNYFGVDAIACVNANGTEANPIVIQSAPGDEGNVFIDGQTTHVGFQLSLFDYITIQNLEIRNMNVSGVISGAAAVREVAANDESLFSVGVKIQGNYIHDIVSLNTGSNPGGIRMDNAKSWLVSNNRIQTVCGQPSEGGCRYPNSGCIYSYYIWNATIENNVCNDSGAMVKWKDHILDENGNPTHPGSIVRYNMGYDLEYGFFVSGGNRDPEASNHSVTNNIFYRMENSCMVLIPDPSNNAQSVNFTFNHNVCEAETNGIVSSEAELDEVIGNIFININSVAGGTYAFNTDAGTQLNSANHNIFIPDLGRMRMARPTAALD